MNNAVSTAIQGPQMAPSTPTFSFAGVNIGRGHVKLKTDRQYSQYASIIQRSQQSSDDLGFMRADMQRVTVDGVSYDVGEEVALVGGRMSDKMVFANWGTSVVYRVLMQSVLDRLAKEGAGPWAIMLGMPVNEHKDKSYRAVLCGLWEGKHDTAFGPVTIEKVATTPEPLGAFWQFVMSQPEKESELINQHVAIVDFGYFTTDINVVNRMRLSRDFASSVQTGMRDVYRLMAELIHRNHRKVCSDIEVEMAVLGKWPLSVRGSVINVREERRIAIESIGERVMEWVKASVDRNDGLVLVCGGGAHVFTELVRRALPDAKVAMVANPQEANAYGYWWLSQTLAETH